MSIPAVTRMDFQQLASERLKEAKALLGRKKWSGAYYLTGYTIELALKACIIKKLMTTDAFPEKKFSNDCYTHDFKILFQLAGLTEEWEAARLNDELLERNWNIVKDWSEQKRYHRIDEAEAKSLSGAVSDLNHGVLSWIVSHW